MAVVVVVAAARPRQRVRPVSLLHAKPCTAVLPPPCGACPHLEVVGQLLLEGLLNDTAPGKANDGLEGGGCAGQVHTACMVSWVRAMRHN